MTYDAAQCFYSDIRHNSYFGLELGTRLATNKTACLFLSLSPPPPFPQQSMVQDHFQSLRGLLPCVWAMGSQPK